MIKKVLFFLIFFNFFSLYSQERSTTYEKLSSYYTQGLISFDLYENISRSILDTSLVGPYTIIYDVDSVSCHGLCDGLIEFNISGPGSDFNFEFNSNFVSQGDSVAFDNLCAGSYSVLITDSMGLFIDFYIIDIEEPANLIILSDSTEATCYGYDDASIDVTPFGDGPFDLFFYSSQEQLDSLLNFTGQYTFDSLSPGDYYLQTYDIHNCLIVDSFFVTEPLPVYTQISTDSLTCFNSCDGQVLIDSVYGVSPFVFSWYDSLGVLFSSSSNEFIDSLCAGIYQVVTTDSAGCHDTVDFVINQPDNLVIDTFSVFDACYDICDGEIQYSATGGTGSLNYFILNSSLDTISFTNSAVNLCPNDTSVSSDTSYILLVQDKNMCIEELEVFVNEMDSFNVDVIVNNETCFAECDAQVYINVNNPNHPPVSYLWSNGSTDSIQSDLCQDSLYVIISDQLGCFDTVDVFIGGPQSPISIYLTTDSVSCFGFCDGIVNDSVTGGTLPYLYDFGGFNPDSLCAGNYTLTITDSMGCQDFKDFDILEPNEIILNLPDSVNSCSVNIDLSVDSNFVSYLWNNGDTTFSINVSQDSLYHVTITDYMGCSKSDTSVVNLLDFDITPLDSMICFGDNIILSINDLTNSGTSVSYLWSNNETTSTIDVTPDQNTLYWVAVNDGVNECYDTTNVFVGNEIILNLPDSVNSCSVNIDLSVDSNFVSYLWNNGDTTFSINVSQDSLYHVTITDYMGCSKSDTSVVNLLDFTINPSNTTICLGDSIILSVSNLTNSGSSFSYLWDNLSSNSSINVSPNQNTLYWVSVYDGVNTCFDTTMVMISDVILNVTTEDISCFGFNDGSASAQSSGGVNPYTYDWSSSSNSSLSPGNYFVISQDNLGCNSDTVYFDILEPTALSSTTNSTDVLCNGDNTGTASVMASGGVSPYSYDWSAQNTNELFVGTYFVTITDDNSCILIDSVIINEPTELELINLSYTDSLQCYGDNDGVASVDATGGTPQYLFDWNGFDPNSLFAETYTVSVTDSNGCLDNLSFTIEEPLEIEIITNLNPPSCYGSNDGNMSVDLLNAFGAINYLWNTGATSQNINNLTSGIYHVSVSDENGCYQYSGDVILEQPDQLEIDFDIFDASCLYSDDGQVSLNIFGGTYPYSFSWSNLETTSDIFNLEVGNYDVTVLDYNDCEITGSVFVSYLDLDDCDKIPTIFTPNGDAQYDVWDIGFLSLFPGCDVKIFNRWGQLLYESSGYDEPWDGTYDGNTLPVADYYYIIDLKNGTEPLTGTITIMR